MKHIEYLASGEYSVNAAEQKIIKLLLGSCVGVALYDRQAKIGGAIHLLLPEPATPDSDWMPASYATTGLPLFINALRAAGADPGRLEAVIAGGALLGKVSKHDLALNIGGRCLEKTHAILEEWRIPIVMEESGGMAPCIMALDTATWQTEITTRFDTRPGNEIPKKPTQKDIIHAIEAIRPIPQAALKIIHLISGGDYDIHEVVATIGTDQVLTSQTLRLCNSALVGPRRPIESIDKAVLILGQGHLLQMVATAAVSSLLNNGGDGYALLKGGLFKHAVGTAHTARILAKETKTTNGGVAYTAGLLHDVGKIVLDRYFASFRPLFYQLHHPGENFLTNLEAQFLGIDHQEAGALLAETWGLPDSIIQVVAHHHQPSQAQQGHSALVHLIYLADLLTSWYLSGHEVELMNAEPMQACLDRLELPVSTLPALIDKVPWNTLMYL